MKKSIKQFTNEIHDEADAAIRAVLSDALAAIGQELSEMPDELAKRLDSISSDVVALAMLLVVSNQIRK